MGERYKKFQDNFTTILTGRISEGDVELNDLCALALVRLDRTPEMPCIHRLPKLTKEQKRQIRQIYGKYVMFPPFAFHRLYTGISGRFEPLYLPEDLYLTTIDSYFTDRKASKKAAHKAKFYETFPGIRQPELLLVRKSGIWINADGSAVSDEEGHFLLQQEPEVVLKQAESSEGGAGIWFLQGENLFWQVKELTAKRNYDMLIQRTVHQHPALERLHPGSLNCLRVVSLYTDGNVKIYTAALKIGTGNSRKDNGKAGGIYVGIKESGILREYGCAPGWKILEEHPDLHYAFAGIEIPHFQKVKALVEQAHRMIPDFRLVSWDVALDDQGEAVLIEANYSMGGIGELQICNGPLFGEDTQKILQEVFSNRRRRLCVFL